MSLYDVTIQLQGLGLKVGLISEVNDPDVGAGFVIASNPGVGERLASGATVDLTVSTGLVAVPEVVGQSMQAARGALEALRLSVNMVPSDSCPSEPSVAVIAQSLIGDAPQGSVVDLSYCAGGRPQ
jgi:beta-lactam-binding protein with PASTA domain